MTAEIRLYNNHKQPIVILSCDDDEAAQWVASNLIGSQWYDSAVTRAEVRTSDGEVFPIEAPRH